jgi:hypothetical protein
LRAYSLPDSAKFLIGRGTFAPTTLFFAHDAQQALAIVRAGRTLQEISLLLCRGKLGITLVDDQMHQRSTHPEWEPREFFPLFFLPLKFAEFDFVMRWIRIERIELVILNL